MMDVPFTFILNAGSGKQDVEAVQALLQRLIPPRRQGSFFVVRPGDDFRHRLKEAVEDCRLRKGILVAAGGDGTINAAIVQAIPLGLTVGVIPLGTFNYFARDRGIPIDLEAAVQSLLDGEPKDLPVYTLNGEPFIVNVSLGLHAKIIAARERHTKITGRNRFVALVSGVITLLKEQYTLRAKLILDAEKFMCKATMVMVSNNNLQLESFALPESDEQEQGSVAVVVVRPLSRAALLKLMCRRLMGQMEGSNDLERYWARQVDIQLIRPYVRVVVDGELKHFRTPLRIRKHPNGIRCLLPRIQEEGPAGEGEIIADGEAEPAPRSSAVS